MGSLTPNYKFFMPDPLDSMADVKKNITDTFKIIEPRNNLTVIPDGQPLPQSGNYEIGDRVYYYNSSNINYGWPSNFMLVCKDANWGWHWRPIQQLMSPWVTVPSTCISNTSFSLHPTHTFQIAMDNKGLCYWRGAINYSTVGIPTATNFVPFKNIPAGLRPNIHLVNALALSPVGSATGKAGNVTARFALNSDGNNAIRFFNSGAAQTTWFTGMKYVSSASLFYGP